MKIVPKEAVLMLIQRVMKFQQVFQPVKQIKSVPDVQIEKMAEKIVTDVNSATI